MDIPFIGPMPAIGLGTWQLNGKTCIDTIKMALELGYRHIDTADMYSNHADIAKGIGDFPRNKLYIITKIVGEELHPQRLIPACRRIAEELQTSYLDALLIHWPSEEIPADKTLLAMMALQEEKLIRHVGVSNFTVPNLRNIEHFNFPLFTNQIELHPYLQEDALVEYCQKHNIIVTAYRPIQRGEVSKEPLLKQIGQKYGKTPVQVTLRWLFQRDIVSIPKATSKEHLKENIEIFDFCLNKQDMQAIAKLNINKRFVS